ncbi:hypothetical protein CBE01nite_33130 [Clostridium beijerinckii]|uniref:Acyltransferase n=1 Tax=Clostridium beijerinckii TaxID=1520 RepID=A0AB74VJC2_CLOBE|nr:acyltransferase [Clostridium beijerinckii]NRZ25597.1 maltose O-acetyltransferase [Clostridium beijerinckii]NYB98112.1 maltose O-acetyltransferase [Clostridium beijerinckii]OOM23273.1 putative acetyltransferase [Clostridium beijerinckii]QUN36350.1 acyltransferase [Clostridium beijerinckii]SQB12941.1 galactoside O-acetyltransferase [Clostridium beijerinckii]
MNREEKQRFNVQSGENIISVLMKCVKWSLSLVRLLRIKLIYGKKIEFNLFQGKPVYIGKNCRFIIIGCGKIIMHNDVYFDDYCTVLADNGRIVIRKDTYFNTFSRLISKGEITIGQGCMFGSNVSVYDHDHDISLGVKESCEKYSVKPVRIGEYVWCGTNVVVTKGITIGCNCVIGANSVVTKNLKSNALYVGNPTVYKKSINSN